MTIYGKELSRRKLKLRPPKLRPAAVDYSTILYCCTRSRAAATNCTPGVSWMVFMRCYLPFLSLLSRRLLSFPVPPEMTNQKEK